ncbi:multidrug MFS transporter [Steroidobacter denitrificans]|uniref:Multidrug MFS transporter n=1 Tax=Steroidobacter denitrificans TaxID=465721 RepID=A0A127F8Y7_STEDE|nr:DHA2 family efflux MFS transporter permease subunit [Steroidobacter denitrificans]AMN46882.1 multidrug MFS transporter [Steroidobacter denitrificans]
MSSTKALFERYGDTYRTLATVTALVAATAVILSATIVNVAIPDVMGTFGIDQVQAQWLSTGFLAAMTATMLLGAWAERAFGLRATFVASLLLFGVGSILGGMAPNNSVLTLARVVQGAAAGIVQPLAMVVLFQVYPLHQRGRAMGVFGIGVVLAPALGPWVGGLLIDNFNWRYVFYLGLPFGALGVVLAAFFLPTREQEKSRPRFDWIGFALLCLFLLLLLSALSNGQRMGWDSDAILLQLAIAAGAIVAFVFWERHTAEPMLALSLFEQVPFAASAFVSFVIGAGLFGSTYLLPLAVQTIQGLTPTQAGLMLMPAGFILAAIFPLSGHLSDRMPPALMIAIGLLIFALASYLTAKFDVNSSFVWLTWLTVLTRLGLGVMFPSLNVASLQVLPRSLISQGSGAVNFMRQLGGAFGVNLLAVLLERRTVFHGEALAVLQTSHNPATAAFIGEAVDLMKEMSLSAGDRVPAALWYLGQALYVQARTEAFRDAFLVTTLVFLIALWPTWLLYRALQSEPPGTAEE